jgi:hypothetical protein
VAKAEPPEKAWATPPATSSTVPPLIFTVFFAATAEPEKLMMAIPPTTLPTAPPLMVTVLCEAVAEALSLAEGFSLLASPPKTIPTSAS